MSSGDTLEAGGEAVEEGFVEGGKGGLRGPVVDPEAVACRALTRPAAEVGEVAGDFGLGGVDDCG